MKPALYLRIAAALTFIHAVLHTIGGVYGKPEPGPAAQAVAAMQANHFLLMGSPRSYWDFYMGMGLCVTVFLTVEAVVFWLLASLANTAGARLRPILAVFAFGYLALAVNSYRYFFVAPVVVETLIALCLLAAIATVRRPTIVD
jgi:hypothetical protein